MAPSSSLFDLEKTGNLIEAGFWIVFGGVIALGTWKLGRAHTGVGLTLSAIVILFGVSDLVEARTGAWWRPRWLLVWKGLCLSGMVICSLWYRRLHSRAASSNADSSQEMASNR